MVSTRSNREELLAAGRRAAYKNQCKSVIVAPDHTGEDNYHNCGDKPLHEGVKHYSGSGYVWDDTGTILERPEGQITAWKREGIR
jgi:hypothetical protein